MSFPCGAYGLSTPYREMSYAVEVDLAGHDPYLQSFYASNASLSEEDVCVSEQCIFPSTVSMEETFHPHSQRDAMACEGKVTQLGHSLSWTDAMYKRLLVFKKEAAESEDSLSSWERAALDINHIFTTRVTSEECEKKYQGLIRKVAIYHEVFGAVPTGTQFDVIERVKLGDMEWNKEKDDLLKSVVEEKKAKGNRSYWDEVTQEMNTLLNEDRTRYCYESRYRQPTLEVNGSTFSPEEMEAVEKEIQSGNYYKFSKVGRFAGVYYTAIGIKLKKTAAALNRVISLKKNRDNPFFKKIREIENRRKSGEFISKETLYTLLGEFAPSVETSLS